MKTALPKWKLFTATWLQTVTDKTKLLGQTIDFYKTLNEPHKNKTAIKTLLTTAI